MKTKVTTEPMKPEEMIHLMNWLLGNVTFVTLTADGRGVNIGT